MHCCHGHSFCTFVYPNDRSHNSTLKYIFQIPPTNNPWTGITSPNTQLQHFSTGCIQASIDSQWKCRVLIAHQLVVSIQRVHPIRALCDKITFPSSFLRTNTTTIIESFRIQSVHDVVYLVSRDI